MESPHRGTRPTRAIVRPPGPNFAQGLTTADLGPPVYALALKQHERYCCALETCGLTLIHLSPDYRHPDSTFVEDTAVVTPRGALVTRPGAASRREEVIDIRHALAKFYPSLASISAPGTLDGGDVCEANGHFIIALSARTDESGARQLADWLAGIGYTSILMDIREIPGLLHLKSGLAYLGDGRLAVADSLTELRGLDGYELVRIPDGEEYAANCVRINEHVLLAAGYTVFESVLRGLGLKVITLDMSEFRKMDGGLSCLSLRF